MYTWRENYVAREFNICCSTTEQNAGAEKISACGYLSSHASAGPPISEAWGGGVISECIYFCIHELLHIQWELWTCAVPIELHWRQRGKCTEISRADIIPFVLLSLVENKSLSRQTLSCRVWLLPLKTKQVNFAAAKKSPAEQQGSTGSQQSPLCCSEWCVLWVGIGTLTLWVCASGCSTQVSVYFWA